MGTTEYMDYRLRPESENQGILCGNGSPALTRRWATPFSEPLRGALELWLTNDESPMKR